MVKTTPQTSFKQLYLISFIEGGVVMVTEIAGAKILTPYFGASLYSWAATLSITLLALMSGYYYGGYITTKPKFTSGKKIFLVFLLSGLSVMLMPSIGNFVMQNTLSLSFFSGLIISELFFLFLPIFLMGMISPMIIFQITKKAEDSGRSAGNIYAISTSGGICFTLIFGFIIIPSFGITLPLRILGLCVIFIAVLLLFKEKLKEKRLLFPCLLVLFLIALFISQPKQEQNFLRSSMKVIEHSEGLLGELKVFDVLSQPPNAEPVVIRKLKINNVQQNFVFRDMPEQSLLYYVNFARQLLKLLPEKGKALLVGLGAGSLYNVLVKQYKEVETVEIDKRIYDVGVKYFNMPAHQNNTITDGRYFINTAKKKYDLIVLDVIIGESVPAQLVTLESFKKCYDLLSPNGALLIEHGGLYRFTGNRFVPSVYKTLQAAGFYVSMFNPMSNDTLGDVVFFASKRDIDLYSLSISDDVYISAGPLSNYKLPVKLFDADLAKVMTDDRNEIDLMLKEHYFEVRKGIRKQLADNKNKN